MATNTLFIPNNTIIFVVNLSQTRKLTESNYLNWSIQVKSFLSRFRLFWYLDGTHPCPPPTKIINNESVPNPEYETWICQDQLIFGALVGTLDQTITPHIIEAKTSQHIWKTLETTFANKSNGHILHIKNRLRAITKRDDQSVT